MYFLCHQITTKEISERVVHSKMHCSLSWQGWMRKQRKVICLITLYQPFSFSLSFSSSTCTPFQTSPVLLFPLQRSSPHHSRLLLPPSFFHPLISPSLSSSHHSYCSHSPLSLCFTLWSVLLISLLTTRLTSVCPSHLTAPLRSHLGRCTAPHHHHLPICLIFPPYKPQHCQAPYGFIIILQ